MLSVCLFVCLWAGVTAEDDPSGQQLLNFKLNTTNPIGILTTDHGAPVNHKHAYYTFDQELLRNNYLIETLSHFNRENIPLRIVHSKGAGAFGFFEVTHDMSHITKAKVFCGVGRKTTVAVRFSPSNTEIGGTDLGRTDNRGFATKFYTEEGNLDLIALVTPIFMVKDPVFFVPFIKSGLRNPVTNLVDDNQFWDIVTKRPETLYNILFVFSERSVPDGYDRMDAHTLHTFQLVNEKGEYHFVRFRWVPDAGVKSLTADQIARLQVTDPDYLTRRLYNQIEKKDYPMWTLQVQVMSMDQVKNSETFDPFDLTRMWPEATYPLQPIGRLVLIKNPSNYFADVRQLAFNVANLVPGILGAPDKVFESRMFAYRDAQNYRLGVNFAKIPVNCPLSGVHTMSRNGRPPVGDNQDGAPDYFPNSFNGPVPSLDKGPVQPVKIAQDDSIDNFDQAREFYQVTLNEREKRSLVDNLAQSLRTSYDFLQERAVKLFTLIHPDLGQRLAFSLNTNETNPVEFHPLHF